MAATFQDNQRFETYQNFNTAVAGWAIADGFATRTARSDKERVVYDCAIKDCNFRVRGNYFPRHDCIIVTL
jgi:hypothetical protein